MINKKTKIMMNINQEINWTDTCWQVSVVVEYIGDFAWALHKPKVHPALTHKGKV